jgi:DNA-binding HxlR family transcriptional regulator
MAQGSYKQFCPVAMTAEVLCTRWTVVLLREMLAGSTRFNDLRRGVPRMSPALLSRRLKELQAADIVERRRVGGDDLHEYHLTRSGRELEPIVAAFGVWGQRWVESEVTLEKLDVQLLMWDMRRNLDTRPMPKRRSTIEFLFSGVQQNQSQWWLIVTPGEAIELCSVDPGFDVDLYIACDLRTMTAIWMGLDSVRAALRDDRVKLTGDKTLASNMQQWLGLSPFAKERKMVA